MKQILIIHKITLVLAELHFVVTVLVLYNDKVGSNII